MCCLCAGRLVYNWFLYKTGNKKETNLKWIMEKNNRDEAFKRSRKFGSLINDILLSKCDKKFLNFILI